LNRLVLVLLGAWIAGSILVTLVANSNFRTVDRLLAPEYRPEFAVRVAARGAAEERIDLRYLAGELNRRLFRAWSWAQVALGIATVGLLLGAAATSAAGRVLAAAATALSLVLALWLTPALLRLGPPLDFIPRPVPPAWQDAHHAFMRLHGLYFAADLAKLVLLVAALVLLLRFRDRPRFEFGPGD
jgi:hypothetical protein